MWLSLLFIRVFIHAVCIIWFCQRMYYWSQRDILAFLDKWTNYTIQKYFFQFEPVIPDISVFKQTNSSVLLLQIASFCQRYHPLFSSYWSKRDVIQSIHFLDKWTVQHKNNPRNINFLYEIIILYIENSRLQSKVFFQSLPQFSELSKAGYRKKPTRLSPRHLEVGKVSTLLLQSCHS